MKSTIKSRKYDKKINILPRIQSISKSNSNILNALPSRSPISLMISVFKHGMHLAVKETTRVSLKFLQ